MTIGRPIEFDPEIALETALNVFWAQGYDGTSLQNILSATGLSKSSLYQVFESKRALFNRCIDRYLSTVADQMKEQLRESESGRKFIEESFYALSGSADTISAKKGCLLWNTILEFGQSEPEMSVKLDAGIDRFSKIFSAAVRRAQKEGDIAADKNAAALGSFLMSSMGGLRAMLKGGTNSRRAKQIADIILQSLD